MLGITYLLFWYTQNAGAAVEPVTSVPVELVMAAAVVLAADTLQ